MGGMLRIGCFSVRFPMMSSCAGESAIFSAALRLAASAGADFLIHVGDLIYRDEQIANIATILATSPLPVFVAQPRPLAATNNIPSTIVDVFIESSLPLARPDATERTRCRRR